MWGDIILSLVTSIGEALYTNFLEKVKLDKFNEKLNKSVEELFDELADTTLDCNDFGKLINSIKFNEMLRNYFCTIKDGLSTEVYNDKFVSYIAKEVPVCKLIEIRRFIKKLEELYTKYLSKVIENNYELNALYKLITVAHRELIGKILESEENMFKYINSLDKKVIDITDKDILAYHNVCNHDFGMIKFIGISGAENKEPQNINEFYVKNTFSLYGKEVSEYKCNSDDFNVIKLEDFFKYSNKIILIGAAGLGKSTTLNYLFCNYETLFDVKALKIKIDLKEYAKNIAEEKKDILWCLSAEFSKRISKTKYTFDEVELIIAQYLDEGKCLIILDALDEIPTQSTRIKVRDEIATFTQVYFLNRFIISTREAGYLKNKFDESFLHIKINDFDDIQIKKYSSNWYKVNYASLSFDDFWGKFNQEVERSKCRDIIRNPIVLILALVIFNIEKNLPNRRVEFYKKCIDTFLEVRENRKSAFEMDSNLKNILGDDSIVPKISYYKFQKINQDIGFRFTFDELNNAIIKAIEVQDVRNWIDPAKRFAQYLITRTELLKEIDDNSLDFAHKTFYEYFLAVYFAKEYDTDELMKLLIVWIGDSNFDELARLIIEVIVERNDPNQHKKMIDYMFDYINNQNISKTGKVTDIFSIIAGLYKNNMLQPKFHEQYNKCIIYNSRLTMLIKKNTRIGRRYYDEVIYDSNTLAEIFIRLLADDYNNIYYIIDSLFYLDKQYIDQVVKRSSVVIQNVALLFAYVRNISSKKRQKNEVDSLKKYFFEEGKDLLVKCPSIYISYVDLLYMSSQIEIDELLFEFSFEPASVFNTFTAPDILYRLIINSFESWKDLLLSLICLIQCAVSYTNWLLGYVVEDIGRSKKKKQNIDLKNGHKLFENCKLLYILLNNSDYEIFKNDILARGLYNSKYDILYRQLFVDYQKRELEQSKYRIENFMEKSVE